jgi:hypothetical protein
MRLKDCSTTHNLVADHQQLADNDPFQIPAPILRRGRGYRRFTYYR